MIDDVLEGSAVPIPTSGSPVVDPMTPRRHECADVRDVDALLREHNSYVVTNLFGFQRPLLWTEKLESSKRGKPMRVFCSFCPFCGAKLEDTAPSQPRSAEDREAILPSDTES